MKQVKQVKITVLKRTLQEGFIREYGVPGSGPCSRHTEGQTFSTGHEKPAGVCNEAWKAISHYVFALAHGAPEGEWFSRN